MLRGREVRLSLDLAKRKRQVSLRGCGMLVSSFSVVCVSNILGRVYCIREILWIRKAQRTSNMLSGGCRCDTSSKEGDR